MAFFGDVESDSLSFVRDVPDLQLARVSTLNRLGWRHRIRSLGIGITGAICTRVVQNGMMHWRVVRPKGTKSYPIRSKV
jgi:hypothetical protein